MHCAHTWNKTNQNATIQQKTHRLFSLQHRWGATAVIFITCTLNWALIRWVLKPEFLASTRKSCDQHTGFSNTAPTLYLKVFWNRNFVFETWMWIIIYWRQCFDCFFPQFLMNAFLGIVSIMFYLCSKICLSVQHLVSTH